MAFKIPKPAYDAKLVAAIEEYLDQDYLTETETETEQEAGGLKYTHARGRARKSYPRPMFEIILDTSFSAQPVNVTPCQCDRFDRSWNCPAHPEIEWDTVRRRWKRPCTGNQAYCQCDPCRERRTTVYTDTGSWAPQGLIDSYRRMMEVGPRPVSVLHIRDSDRSYEATVLRDNREMQQSVMAEASREAARTGWPVRGQVLGRWARIHADGRIIFEQRPEEMIRYVGSSRENSQGLVRSPGQIIAEHRDHGGDPNRWVPDVTVQLEGTWVGETGPRTLEIDCETEQGAGPLQIEVEPNDGH